MCLAFIFLPNGNLDLGNKFRDFEKFKKNMVRNIVKSARGRRRSSRGGLLLSEFETSPLQVI